MGLAGDRPAPSNYANRVTLLDLVAGCDLVGGPAPGIWSLNL